jgi:Phospholipase/Carboxylesterase
MSTHDRTVSGRALSLAAVLLACVIAPARAQAPDAEVTRHTIAFDGAERVFHTYHPVTAAPRAPMLMLLHGSYQTGLELLTAWKQLADEAGLVLVAPDATDIRYWQIREDGPAFIRAVAAAAVRSNDIDPDHIYLFGISGGAVHALTIAMLESQDFAAVAVFAGAWRDERSYAAIDAAVRKIPVSIFIGSRDEYFPLRSVRNTQVALERAGHPVEVTVLPRRRHDYGKVADTVNPQAWEFLRAYRLSATTRGGTVNSQARDERQAGSGKRHGGRSPARARNSEVLKSSSGRPCRMPRDQ